MVITDVIITLTKGTGRQLADVAIVMDNEIRINNIKLINNGKKIFYLSGWNLPLKEKSSNIKSIY